MHYYQFNIKDYRKDTAHLQPIEHYIYRQLIDWYYLDELEEIPKKTQLVLRRLSLVTQNEPDLLNVLNDFFYETETGWKHKRIDEEIARYRANSEKNRENGKKGGRPRKQQVTSEEKPNKTQSVPNANPSESEKNPNQQPITNNQSKEKTKGKKKEPHPDDLSLAAWVWSHVNNLAPGQRKPNFNVWAEDIRKMKEIDKRSPEDIKAVFLWAHNDDFWKTNIRAPAKLRARFDDLNAKRINQSKNQKPKAKTDEDFSSKKYTGTPRENISWL